MKKGSTSTSSVRTDLVLGTNAIAGEGPIKMESEPPPVRAELVEAPYFFSTTLAAQRTVLRQAQHERKKRQRIK
ncbi:hypothetical protein [Sphingomonas sp. Leaf33]|uniref:hypothetical protein n=1 Tax=Sphingomonas sp. Leaf33 TaxID=1736215 RepID=UPI0012E11AF5|nr:hypothetical protein [Sphingomonas sp. Leaf33]